MKQLTFIAILLFAPVLWAESACKSQVEGAALSSVASDCFSCSIELDGEDNDLVAVTKSPLVFALFRGTLYETPIFSQNAGRSSFSIRAPPLFT